jgi:hypothetical protein
VALLAWDVVRTEGPAADDTNSSGLPKPEGEVRLTRDAALLEALRHVADNIRGLDVEVSLTTLAGARSATDDMGYSPLDPPDDTPTWLVVLRGMFSECVAPTCFPVPMPASPVPGANYSCADLFVTFYDASPFYGGTRGAPVSDPCPTAEPSVPLSRDEALVKAAFDPSVRVYLGAPLVASHLEQTSYGETLDILAARGWPKALLPSPLTAEAPVWVVTLKGPLHVPASLASGTAISAGAVRAAAGLQGRGHHHRCREWDSSFEH